MLPTRSLGHVPPGMICLTVSVSLATALLYQAKNRWCVWPGVMYRKGQSWHGFTAGAAGPTDPIMPTLRWPPSHWPVLARLSPSNSVGNSRGRYVISFQFVNITTWGSAAAARAGITKLDRMFAQPDPRF